MDRASSPDRQSDAPASRRSRTSGRLTRPTIHRGNAAAWANALESLGRFDAALRARLVVALLALGSLFFAYAVADARAARLLPLAVTLGVVVSQVAMVVALIRFFARLPSPASARLHAGAAVSVLAIGTVFAAQPLVQVIVERGAGGVPGWLRATTAHAALGADSALLVASLITADALRRVARMLEATRAARHASSAMTLLAAASVFVVLAHVLATQGQRVDHVLAVGGLAFVVAVVGLARLLGSIRHLRSEAHDPIADGADDRTSEWESIARL